MKRMAAILTLVPCLAIAGNDKKLVIESTTPLDPYGNARQQIVILPTRGNDFDKRTNALQRVFGNVKAWKMIEKENGKPDKPVKEKKKVASISDKPDKDKDKEKDK